MCNSSCSLIARVTLPSFTFWLVQICICISVATYEQTTVSNKYALSQVVWHCTNRLLRAVPITLFCTKGSSVLGKIRLFWQGKYTRWQLSKCLLHCYSVFVRTPLSPGIAAFPVDLIRPCKRLEEILFGDKCNGTFLNQSYILPIRKAKLCL